MARREDYLGHERPIGQITPQIALPDTVLLTPVRLPRAQLSESSVQEDYYATGRRPPTQHRQPQRFTTYEDVNTFFRRDLEARRLSELDLADLNPPSNGHRQYSANGYNGHRRSPPTETATDIYRGPATVPRTRDHREHYPPPATAGVDPAHQQALHLTRPTAAAQRVETQSQTSVAETIRSLSERALYRNPCISFQRFTFTLAKFPALVLVFVSMWRIWSRGQGVAYQSNEKESHLAAFVTGLFILSAEIVLLHQHYNNYKKALAMAIFFHIVMLLSLCGSTVSLVYGALSFSGLKNLTTTAVSDCKLNDLVELSPEQFTCITVNNRIDYSSVILGANVMVICLALLTMVLGAVGQALMKRKQKEEYQRYAADRHAAQTAITF